MPLGPLGQVARPVKDIEAARRWYGDVLGLKHLYSFGNLAFFQLGEVRLFLSQEEGESRDAVDPLFPGGRYRRGA